MCRDITNLYVLSLDFEGAEADQSMMPPYQATLAVFDRLPCGLRDAW